MTLPIPSDKSTLYLADNGRCLCGEHLGCTARYTGHDLSGETILPCDATVRLEAASMGYTLHCESCS